MQRECGDGERWRMTGDGGRGRQRAFLGEGTPIGDGASFLRQSDVRSWRSSAILAGSAKLSGGRTMPSGDRPTPFPDGVAPSNRKIPPILGAVTPSLSEATPYDGERLPFPADWHSASAECPDPGERRVELCWGGRVGAGKRRRGRGGELKAERSRQSVGQRRSGTIQRRSGACH